MLSLVYFSNEVIVFSPFTGSLCVQRKQGLGFFIWGLSFLLKNAVYFIRIHVRVRSSQGIWEMYTSTSMVYDIYDFSFIQISY